jgi:hypothetical protein
MHYSQQRKLADSRTRFASLYKLRSQGGVYIALQLSKADYALAPKVVPSFISRGATTPSGAVSLY